MARRWTVAAGACLATTLLAGCSGSTPQASTTLPTTSAPATASPTLPPLGPADFPVPAEARVQTAIGATAELRYYLALVGRGPRPGETAVRDLSNDCTFCSYLADRLDRDAAAGYSYRGGTVTLDQVGAPAIHGSLAEFTFTASQAEVAVLNRSGQPVPGRGDTSAAGLRGAAAMTWDRSRSVWLVTQLSFTQP